MGLLGGCSKNRFHPQQSAYGGNGIGEGYFLFDVPRRARGPYGMTTLVHVEDETNNAEQAQQTRGAAQHRLGHALSRRLEAQVGADLFKGDLDRPAAGEQTHDALRREVNVCAKDAVVSMGAVAIHDINPADLDRAPMVVPQARAGQEANPTRADASRPCRGSRGDRAQP